MKTSRWMLVAVLAGLAAAPGRADEANPTKDEAAAQQRADAMALVPQAGDLAAVGRDVKSAETLVVAGGMLLRANSLFGGATGKLDDKPTGKDGKPVADEAKTVPLATQADALFDEARSLAAGSPDKNKLSGVEAMIKAVSAEFPKRGSVGGPKTVTRTLGPGETHTYNMTFVAGQTAAVSMTSTGPPKIQFDVTHVKGTSLFSLKGHNANYTWVPVRDRDGVRNVTVTLTNMGRNPTTYTFSKN